MTGEKVSGHLKSAAYTGVYIAVPAELLLEFHQLPNQT